MKINKNIAVGMASFVLFAVLGAFSASGIGSGILFAFLFLVSGAVTLFAVTALYENILHAGAPDWFKFLAFAVLCFISKVIFSWSMITPFYTVGILCILSDAVYIFAQSKKNVISTVMTAAISLLTVFLFPIICVSGGIY